MDDITIDTVRIRTLANRITFPDGTVFEQLSDDNFKKSNLAGEHLGYARMEAIEYKDTLKAEYFASRQTADAEALRILDQGIDRTPQQL